MFSKVGTKACNEPILNMQKRFQIRAVTGSLGTRLVFRASFDKTAPTRRSAGPASKKAQVGRAAARTVSGCLPSPVSLLGGADRSLLMSTVCRLPNAIPAGRDIAAAATVF